MVGRAITDAGTPRPGGCVTAPRGPSLICALLALLLGPSWAHTALGQTTLDISVSTNNDDAHEDPGGDVKLNDGKIELGQMPWAGFRFQNVTIPQGATITSAYVRFISESSNTESTSLTVFADNADNSASFSNSNKLSTRSLTTTSADWSGVPSWTAGGSYQTPDLTAVVQEVVDRSGWADGNSLSVLVRSDDLSGKRLPWARDDHGSDQALLHVEYTTGVVTEGLNANLYSASDPRDLDDIDWSATPLLSYTELQVNFSSTGGAMLPGAPNDRYGVRFYGEVYVTTGGAWTFYTNSDDGSKLYINGAEIVDNDGLHGMRERSGSVTLAAGWHPIQIDFFERTGGAGVIASWEGPGVSKEVIPMASLRASSSGPGSGGSSNAPIAIWRLDDASGTTATDDSSNSNHGALTNGPVWLTNGVYDGALCFDGSNDYVEIAHNDAYLADNGTVSFWFNADDLSGSQGLFSKDSTGFDTGGHLSIRLEGSRLNVRQQTTSASSEVESDPLVPGKWYFVVYQWGAGGQRLLIDNIEADINASFSSGLGTSSGGAGNFEPIALGGSTANSGNLTVSSVRDHFSGYLDDVYLFDRRISDEEITALFGLRGQWKFDDGSGATAADSSGNGNNGGLNGGAAFMTACNGTSVLGVDGSGDYVEIADNASLRFSSNATLAGWFRLDDDFDSTTPTVTLADKFLNNNNNMHLALAGSNYNRSQVKKGSLVFKLENSGYNYNWTATDAWEGGVWRHVAAVFDKEDPDHVRIYVDGVEDTDDGYGNGSNSGFDFGAPLRFGGFDIEGMSDNFFPGQMSDWRLYSRALSDEEIRQLAGQILHWKFDETSGLTAYDASGNAFNGDVQANNEWVSGQVDGAIRLHGDSSSDRGDVRNTAVAGVLNGLDQLTIALWVNSDRVDEDRGIFIGGNPTGGDDILALRYDKDGFSTGNDRLLKAALRTTSGNQSLESDDDTQTLGWQHLALVWTSGNDLQLYIDGVLANVQHSGSALSGVVTGVTQLRVGIGTKSQYWDGLLDDFRIYRRALCPSEIAELASSSPGTGLRITRWVEVATP